MLLSSRRFQAGAKMWLVLVVALMATLATLYTTPSLSGHKTPVFGYVAAVLTVSERSEATVSKFATWIAGTLVGGCLGFGLMASLELASNPAALGAILCASAFAVGALGVSRFRVLITLALMTLSADVLCQHCVPTCEHAGSVEYFLSRVMSVLCGIALAVLVSSCVLPWYTSEWALQKMTGAYRQAVALPAIAYAKHREDAIEAIQRADEAGRGGGKAATAQGSSGSSEEEGSSDAEGKLALPEDVEAGPPDLPPLPPFSEYRSVLMRGVVEPLTAVQASLVMDATLWQRGLLATPCVVAQMLHTMLRLTGPLDAMQAALRPPDITGAFEGEMFRHFVMAIDGLRTPVHAALFALGPAVERHVLRPDANSAARLQAAIDHLLRSRMASRSALARIKVAQHAALVALGSVIGGTESGLAGVHIDDVARTLGFQHAWLRSLDLATGVATVTLRPECRARNTAASLLK